MAAPNIENGQYMRVKIEDPNNPGTLQTISHSTSTEMSWTADTRDVSNKDLAGWSAVKRGRKSAEISGEFLHSWDAEAGKWQIEKLFEFWNDGELLTVEFFPETGSESGTAGGRKKWTGTFLFVDLNLSAADQENMTSSYTLQNVGPVTMEADS